MSSMPAIDTDSPFIIVDGRIVENPYYKYRKDTGRINNTEEAQEIKNEGVYVVSGGGLSKVNGNKIEPQIPKEDKPKKTRKPLMPNVTSTPGFTPDAQLEYTRPVGVFNSDLESGNLKYQRRAVDAPAEFAEPIPGDEEEYVYESDEVFEPVSEEPTMPEDNITIINDSSNGRNIIEQTDSINYPRERVLKTTRDTIIKDGKEVKSPYEKVEMKIGDVEIKFWKKDTK